jgi:asparagine synthase (glutamine-hydrolysing)
MSGFAGIVRIDGRPADADEMARLQAAIAHRGPDDHREWSGSGATLVHAMLHTTPESLREPQPHADGELVIVSDLRVDNRVELLATLPVRPDAGDAALVLAAYRKWGGECARRIEGDFAFAIWDSRQRTLFCARDPFGVKPFVYSHVPGRLFAFSAELRALLAIADVPRQIDEQRVADFLRVRFEDTERTFVRAATRLPGGCTLTLRDGIVKVDRFWSPDRIPSIRHASDAEYAEGFREHLVRAVRERMRAVRTAGVGALLSGGLDSSAIACVARDELAATGSSPLPVFSWIFSDVLQADEREFQEIVVRNGGMVQHTIDSADGLYSPWSALESLLPDGPPYAPNFYLNLGIGERARSLGVRVLLDGLGGDSSISRGGARFVELFVRGRFLTLAKELRAFASMNEEGSAMQVFRGRVLAPLIPPALLDAMQSFRGRAPDPWQGLLKPRFAQERDAQPRFRPHLSVAEEHRAHLRSPMLAEGLELFDRVMAIAGVEGRYPFFDRRLVEYCVSLPSAQKLAGGFSRVVARRGMADIVPDAVRWRAGKGKPGLHIIPALRASRERIDALLLRDPSVLEPWVNVDLLRSLARDFFEGRAPNPFLSAVRLWGAVAAALWLREW